MTAESLMDPRVAGSSLADSSVAGLSAATFGFLGNLLFVNARLIEYKHP
jgi:hypothetical protein